MAKASPEDPFASPCRSAIGLAKSYPDLELFDRSRSFDGRADARRRSPRKRRPLRSPASPTPAGPAPRAGMGGLVLVTSHGFSGSYMAHPLRPLRQRRLPAKAPRWSATTTYDSRLYFDELDALPTKSAASPASGPSTRINPRQVADRQERHRRFRSAHGPRLRRPSRRRHQRRVGRPQDQLPARHDGQAGHESGHCRLPTIR